MIGTLRPLGRLRAEHDKHWQGSTRLQYRLGLILQWEALGVPIREQADRLGVSPARISQLRTQARIHVDGGLLRPY